VVTLRRLLVIPLLAAIFAFYAVTIRDGHVWDDDAAMYILHARNIAEGRPYSDTGYIFNPEYAALGPVAYPPGLPLLLAPVWAASGLNLYAMKLLEVGLFVASLAFLYALFRKHLGEPECLVLVSITGLCPMLWDQKEFIGSDLAFLPFLFLALLAMERAYARASPPRLGEAAPIGLLIWAAYAIRIIGMALLPTLIACDWLRTRRISRFAVVTTLVAVALCVTQSRFAHSEGALLSLVRFDPQTAIHNAWMYGKELRWFWLSGKLAIVSWILYGATLVAAAWGLLERLRRPAGLRIAELFLVFYAGFLLFYQPNEPRFLLPVFPIYVALAVEVAGRLIRRLRSPARVAVAAALLAALGIGYSAQYAALDWGPIRESFLDDDFLQVADFVRSHTSESDVFLFRKPRVLPLLTGRRAATYAMQPGLGEFVRGLHPDYLVAVNAPAGIFASDADYLWPFIKAHAQSLQLAYRNSTYSIYRVLAP